jgi:chemotaxis signal transduction protein
LAAPEIAGLINSGGSVLTAIDLRVRQRMRGWNGPQATGERGDPGQRGSVSLLVDEIGGAVEVRHIRSRDPDHGSGPIRELLLGTYTLPTGWGLALDAPK